MKKENAATIGLLVAGCIIVNIVGKQVAIILSLPLWLDAIGTIFGAYILGPFCGAVIGAASNVIYGMWDSTAYVYSLVSIVIALIVGFCKKRKMFDDLFHLLTTGFLITMASLLVSVFLNYFFYNGYTGNLWGDGVINFLLSINCIRYIACLVGEFYVDFPDKVIIIFLLYFMRWLGNIKRKKQVAASLLGICMVISLAVPVVPARAAETGAGTDINEETGEDMDDPDTEKNEAAEEPVAKSSYDDYVQLLYNGMNGLPGGAANDIAQTKDGVLWIGTYSGLYRYNGNTFSLMKDFQSVKNVNCIHVDEEGRMWIGTNDCGLSLCINGEITNVIDTDRGLSSNSVRSITKDIDGNYYVGTSAELDIVSLRSGVSVVYSFPDITYAHSLSADATGHVAAVTDAGELYLLCGTQIVARENSKAAGTSFTSCFFDEQGDLYVGTSGGNVLVYKVSERGFALKKNIDTEDLSGINSITATEEGRMFVCADTGAGYLGENDEFCKINTNTFNSSIEKILVDYQGNLWFVSSRLGLLKLTEAAFTNAFAMAGLPETVANTIIKWQGTLYYGTDSGLFAVDADRREIVKSNGLTQALKGVRIRCLAEDADGNLWISTSGSGVWSVTPTEDITVYDESAGVLGTKFRHTLFLDDGTIVIAGDSGISYVKNGRVTHTIGAEAMENPKVLCVTELDGILYAGTDGGGIYVIKNGNVTSCLNRENGLSSDVVMKIVEDKEGQGAYIVTSNGLCYMDAERKITLCEHFPYYNNFDVFDYGDGRLFVLSSAGVYVINRAELLAGEELKISLLDAKQGLFYNLTANAWNYLDENGVLYLAAGGGVVYLDVNNYRAQNRAYRMDISSVIVDGISYPVSMEETLVIPDGSSVIDIRAEIINYSVNDPYVSVFLSGYEDTANIVRLSELSNVIYTNLDSGNYTLVLSVYGDDGEVVAANHYSIVKEKEIYNKSWFRVYMVLVMLAAIFYLTWMLYRTQLQKTLNLHKKEMQLVKQRVEMIDSAIMTIAQTVDAKDENTSKHSMRVAEYSVLIAKRLGYSEEAQEELRRTALLHDIGKIGIADNILNKPSKLTDEEYRIMKSHVKKGAEILEGFTLAKDIVNGARYHHERYDGKGYMEGLRGEEIPKDARIIGIADAFDAMTANRVYRKKLSMDYVLGELEKGRGTQFDPELVDVMLGLISEGVINPE